MKAFVIHQYGSAEELAETDLPVPAPADNEVLIAIHAASINQLDLKVKSGTFKRFFPYKLPLVLGYDVAGVVVKTGADVRRFKAGDAVFALSPSPGAFAEYITLKERDVAFMPAKVSMEEAASFPLVALTVWQAFVGKANIKPGQKVFIQAGSGGVGTIAIQLAKHLGATVATTTSARNSELVKALGADVVIDYHTQDFETLLKDYDVVLNSQDIPTLEKSIRILKPGGKVISISSPADVKVAKEMGLSWLLRMVIAFMSRKIRKQAKRGGVDYSFLFVQANGAQLREISTLVEKGLLLPVVDSVYEKSEINEALEYVQSGRAKGKVVIQIK